MGKVIISFTDFLQTYITYVSHFAIVNRSLSTRSIDYIMKNNLPAIAAF